MELRTKRSAQSISFSPYLPQQHDYNDWIPSQAYYAFAIQAGCAPVWAYGNVSQTIFQCLVSKDSATLQAASASVSRSGPYGTWAFLPVTDGDLIQSTPSKALTSDRLNGRAHLTSNVAEEAFIFVPRTIHTAEDLTAWIKLLFPSFNFRDILFHYPYQNTSAQPKFATSGLTTPTALQTSSTSTSYQQLANLIYAEATFMCPSYWLAQAFNTGERKGWKMQYSVPVALHGYDGIALVGNTRLPIHSDDFILALQKIIGNFVVNADPGFRPFKAPDWPMMNLNQTGGMEVDVSSTLDLGLNGTGAKWNIGPGLKNNFEIVNGSEWEGGRGVRCEFWRGLGLEGMSL
jgi:carboxylesterase type B